MTKSNGSVTRTTEAFDSKKNNTTSLASVELTEDQAKELFIPLIPEAYQSALADIIALWPELDELRNMQIKTNLTHQRDVVGQLLLKILETKTENKTTISEKIKLQNSCDQLKAENKATEQALRKQQEENKRIADELQFLRSEYRRRALDPEKVFSERKRDSSKPYYARDVPEQQQISLAVQNRQPSITVDDQLYSSILFEKKHTEKNKSNYEEASERGTSRANSTSPPLSRAYVKNDRKSLVNADIYDDIDEMRYREKSYMQVQARQETSYAFGSNENSRNSLAEAKSPGSRGSLTEALERNIATRRQESSYRDSLPRSYKEEDRVETSPRQLDAADYDAGNQVQLRKKDNKSKIYVAMPLLQVQGIAESKEFLRRRASERPGSGLYPGDDQFFGPQATSSPVIAEESEEWTTDKKVPQYLTR